MHRRTIPTPVDRHEVTGDRQRRRLLLTTAATLAALAASDPGTLVIGAITFNHNEVRLDA